MQNRWSDADAAAIIADHKARDINEDVALRVYTSRLIGGERELVIHGGGNTSVKTRLLDFLGEETDVLCVKGSGWDLATIEAPGLPAVRLEPLRRVRAWNALSDEDMVRLQRLNLLDPGAPNPSVEALLHAFLPHKFVDHSHATAILAISDQPNGNDLCREIFGDKVAVVPYVMAGFHLAKATADAYDAAPAVEGVLLEKHGFFTFGDTARQSYDRMIDLVSVAEAAVEEKPAWAPAPRVFDAPTARAAEIAPIIRGACADAIGDGSYHRLVSDFRRSNAIMTFVNGAALPDYGTRGVVTPDHIIRTKNRYLIAPHAASDDLSGFKASLHSEIAAYRARYDDYFDVNNARLGG
ncbi:MAG: class II aldolase/adducin family protein, partial [Pseudomonadota bacterium]